MSIQDPYCDKKTGRIYVELFGELHWIVDEPTLRRVFGPNPETTDDVPSCPEGFNITPDSCLIKNAQGKISLYTCGAKHWISSMAAMEHYQFNGPRFPQEPQDMIVADNLLRLAQDGKQISV
jgi:hypothetical protein